MAHKIVPEGPFNLSQLEYGATSRIQPSEYDLKGSMPTHHTVMVGEDLNGIANLYGYSTEELFHLNRGELDRAAKLHGQPDSDLGRKLYPGTTLRV